MTTTEFTLPIVGDGSGLEPDQRLYVEELELALRNHALPLEALRHDVTPTGLHYTLVHYDIPLVDPTTWQLSVNGAVQRPLTLALDADYGSHEAFTRAFRDHFGVTPEAVRGSAHLDNLKLQEPITMDSTVIDNLKPPRFETGKPLLIAGLGELHGGPIEEGRPANLCVIDPDETWTVDADKMSSRSRNTPFEGASLTGKVRHTLYVGEPVVVEGKAQR